MRLECKTTSAKSYKLELADIEKVRAEAVMGGLEGWALQVEFQGSPPKRFAVIDWQEYLDLRTAQKTASQVDTLDPFRGFDLDH